METLHHSIAFAALGHPSRLALFRLLMRFAPQGVRPTEIAQALGMKANTLSHHLSELARARLITATRDGRSLRYAVDLDMTEALIGYLALDLGRGRADLMGALSGMQPAGPAPDQPLHVLFLCTANSARSIFAEALLRDLGAGRFVAHSAGTQPRSAPHPDALNLLGRKGHALTGLRAKHLSEFQHPEAPAMDFVFTVCDTAAAEDCPAWPGQPISAHWGLPDPARATGSAAETALAFAQTYAALRQRIAALIALPIAALDRLSLQTHVDAIGMLPNKEA